MLFPSSEEISSVIAASKSNQSRDFAHSFREHSVSKDDGWDLLQWVFNLYFQPSHLTEPFGRDISDVDFSDEEIDALRSTLEGVDDPEYRARVSDVLWLKCKDPNAARNAVESYLDAGQRVEHPETWTSSMDRYERAIRLARQIEPKGELPKKVLAHLESRVIHYDGTDPKYFTCRALEFLAEFRTGDFTNLAAIAGRVAEQSRQDGNFRRARSYYEVQAKHLKLAKENDQAESARVAAARSFVDEAEAREANDEYMAAHSFWEDAICAFRNRPSLRTEIPELQKRYANAGKKLLCEMTTISSDAIDLSKYVEESRATISDLPWVDAFYEFVSIVPLIDPSDLRRLTEENIEKNPVHATLTASIYDVSGRKVGVRPSAVTEDKEQYEKAITGHMLQLMEWQRGRTIHAFIAPAVRQIIEDHHVDQQILASVLDDSLLIPPERREPFYQAFEAGFQWDFSTALHILIPQVENALRYVLEQQDVTPVNIDNAGVEEVWGMEKILSHSKTLETFGEEFVFELESLLVDRLGPNLRNLLAHGGLSPDVFKTPTAFYLWWVIIRLSAYPTSGMRAFLERKQAAAIKEN